MGAPLYSLSQPSILPSSQANAGATKTTAAQIQQAAASMSGAQQQAFVLLGNGIASLQNQINTIMRALRAPLPPSNQFGIQDPTGRLALWVGYQGIGNAANYGITAFGPMQNVAAWLGVQQELPLAITATSDGSPDVITITGHPYINGDTLNITGCTGDTAPNGSVIVENAATNTFQLTDLNGNPINGNGTYAGGGSAQRYYAGLLAQTIAIGQSFSNFKLRGFADGTLEILNALISLVNGTKSITIDPTIPAIVITDTSTGVTTELGGSTFPIVVQSSAGAAGIGVNSVTLQDASSHQIALVAGVGISIDGHAGATGTVPLAKLTIAGANGSITFYEGIVTGAVAPT